MSLLHPKQNRFPRVKASILCRPARFRDVHGLSGGKEPSGLRIYGDDRFPVGQALEIDLVVGENTFITCLARVAWVRRLGPEGPAPYDIGLDLLQVPPDQIDFVTRLLDYES